MQSRPAATYHKLSPLAESRPPQTLLWISCDQRNGAARLPFGGGHDAIPRRDLLWTLHVVAHQPESLSNH